MVFKCSSSLPFFRDLRKQQVVERPKETLYIQKITGLGKIEERKFTIKKQTVNKSKSQIFCKIFDSFFSNFETLTIVQFYLEGDTWPSVV